ncbi:MAG: hypothetical protein U9R54_05770 [Bacteroidota bacterium]|nr:hypothetical protein [Bacteroidota bacterium]
MKIIQATTNNLIEINFLIFELNHFSKNEKCNYEKYNSNKLPTLTDINTEIANKNMFILQHKRSCLAAIILNKEIDFPDNNINWKNTNEQYLSLNHIIIHPYSQNKGLEKQLIDFAIEKVKKENYKSLRFKAYGNNKQYIEICNNSGFEKTGKFFYPKQEAPFYCYEKMV